jgi:hypothetical protein
MDPTKFRTRYLIVFLVAAVLTAGLLRHVLHVGAGFSREEIRTVVLIAAAAWISLAVAFFRWGRRS